MDVRPRCMRCRKLYEEYHLEALASVNVCLDCIVECLLLIISKLNRVHFLPAKRPPRDPQTPS